MMKKVVLLMLALGCLLFLEKSYAAGYYSHRALETTIDGADHQSLTQIEDQMSEDLSLNCQGQPLLVMESALIKGTVNTYLPVTRVIHLRNLSEMRKALGQGQYEQLMEALYNAVIENRNVQLKINDTEN